MRKFFRYLAFLLLTTPSLQIFATEQYPDYLIYNGDTLEMYSYPFESYRKAHPNPIYDTLFECRSTALYRGYVAYWEIRRDSLFLIKVEVYSYNPKRYEAEFVSIDKSIIFKEIPYDSDIFASWVNSTCLVFLEDTVNKNHSECPNERTFTFQNGKLKNTKFYDNSKTSAPMDWTMTRHYIQHNINFSRIHNLPQEECVVNVNFDHVSKNGGIRKATAVCAKGNCSKEMLKEAVRVVKSIPRYNVYYHYGKPMRYEFSLPVCFSDSLRQLQSQAFQPPIDPWGKEGSIIREKEDLTDDSNDPYTIACIASYYFDLAKDIYRLTPEDTKYDKLYLKMYGGDSTVLWHYRCRHAADSALKYYYLNWEVQPKSHHELYDYYDIRQLETLLKVAQNPAIQLPEDTTGRYFDNDQFVQLPENWMTDFNIDVYDFIGTPYSLVQTWSWLLKDAKEPTLHPLPLQGCTENLRFILAQVALETILVRVDISENHAVLHWKSGDRKDFPGGIYMDSIVAEGSRVLTDSELLQLRKMLSQVDLSSQQPLPQWYGGCSRWLFEHRTSDRFDAIEKIDPPKPYVDLGLQLIRWAGLDVDLYY